jgi:catechol 2,3-dioxygenase-like lactoylglutathione lyase family enzyme/GNAT superfamily N-acetyltransferase
MEAEVIGIDHVYLSVRALAASEAFYDRALLQVLGFRKNSFVLAGAPHIQYFNRQFGFVIRPARPAATPHDAGAPGLHHFCFRVTSQREVERVAEGLRACGIEATPAGLYPDYAPDYCATFFHDPDGVRLEVTNFRAERRERMENWRPGTDAVALSNQIRPATLDDCGPIAALIHELSAEREGGDGAHQPAGPDPAANLERTAAVVRDCIGAAEHHQLLVSVAEGRIAGYIAVHWIPLPLLSGSEGYVSDLYLGQACRGGGLGKQLMDAVERLAVQRGCLRLMLNNRLTSRSYLREFYPKLGFRRRDEFANFVKTLAPGLAAVTGS